MTLCKNGYAWPQNEVMSQPYGNSCDRLPLRQQAQCDAWFSALYKYSYLLT